MRTMMDIKCERCACTTSCQWIEPQDVIAAHVCLDGGCSEAFVVTERIVLGPGESSREEDQP